MLKNNGNRTLKLPDNQRELPFLISMRRIFFTFAPSEFSLKSQNFNRRVIERISLSEK